MDADHNGAGRVITDEIQIKGGSDLSENFNISSAKSGQIKSGLVVSIDPKNPGQLELSQNAYDTKIAGIISGANGVRPGLIMGQEGSIADGDYPVALTGRVYVEADASHHSISPGDLLTSSDLPGIAMKAVSKRKSQGAILGKAMTGLESGQGKILVLISLQ